MNFQGDASQGMYPDRARVVVFVEICQPHQIAVDSADRPRRYIFLEFLDGLHG